MPVVSCIFNDGGMVQFHKLRAEGLRDDGANFGHSELHQIARGFDIKGYLENLQQLEMHYRAKEISSCCRS